MLGRLSRLATGRPRFVAVAAAVFAVGAAALGGPIVGELEAQRSDFQDPAAENLTAEHRLERAAGSDDRFGVVAVVRAGGDVRTSSAARARVVRVQRTIERQRGFDRVVSFLDRGDPSFLSRDGRSTFVVARWRGPGDEDAAVKRLERALQPPGVLLGGPDVVFPKIRATVSHDLARAELIAFPLLFLLALLVFRGAVAALIPPLVGGVAIVATFLALRAAHQFTGLSIFALNLVTGLGLGLAIDYSLFIVSRYREELATGASPAQAVATTLQTAGRTVLFSALTVAAAMASLLVFPLRFLYSMGLGGTIVALLAAGVALVVLPAVLVLLGHRVNALAPAWLQRGAARDARPDEQGAWYRLSRAIMRRPGRVAAVSAGVLLLAGLPSLRIAFGPANASVLPKDAPARQATEALQRDFPSERSDAVEVAIAAPRADRPAVVRYRARLADVAGRDAAVSAPSYLGRNTWRIDAAPRADPNSDRSRDLVREMRSEPAPFAVWMGGPTAEFLDQQSSLGDGLPLAGALLAASTLVLLFLMTGSVVLPVKALAMNLLTLSATFGLLVLVFQDGRLEGLLAYDGSGTLEATQPILLCAIAFGLSTDYGVFLLSRIKEARDAGLSNREAVARGLERSGRIVTAAALLFCVAIGAFATSSIVFIKELGVGTALAVAIDATIVRALLVPALMELLGEWNWWAPRPLRRLHERLGLREGAAST